MPSGLLCFHGSEHAGQVGIRGGARLEGQSPETVQFSAIECCMCAQLLETADTLDALRRLIEIDSKLLGRKIILYLSDGLVKPRIGRR